jgi:hypothetical protein
MPVWATCVTPRPTGADIGRFLKCFTPEECLNYGNSALNSPVANAICICARAKGGLSISASSLLAD